MDYILLQTQSTASAAFEIFVMLLGAAAIGAVTAFFYFKASYKMALSSIESKLVNSKKLIEKISKELENVNREILYKNELLDQLEGEYSDLKGENEKLKRVHEASQGLYLKAIDETEEANKMLHEKENELKENDNVLQRIAERKHLLDYASFGKADEDNKNDLKIISGIGPFIQEKLNMLDIYTFEQISNFSKNDISTVNNVIEFFPGRIDRDEWVPQAQELVYSGGEKTALFERMKSKKHKIDYSKIGIAHKEDAQDLTEIHGIGPFIQEKLNFLGIYTFKQISKFTEVDVDTVTDIIEFFPGRIDRDRWVGQARELAKQIQILG